jgi:hypothetical protein
MIVHRRAATLIATILVLLSSVVLSPAGALASGTPPASLSPTAQPTAQPRGTLPFTGFDLPPEVLVGAALIAAGAGIQVALRIRRA